MSGVGWLNLKVVNFKQTHLSNAPKILGDGIGTMNYVDVRIAFQRATEAALEALRRESKQQVREALIQYWLAKKRLRIAKAATIGNRRFMTANLAVQSLPSKTKTSKKIRQGQSRHP